MTRSIPFTLMFAAALCQAGLAAAADEAPGAALYKTHCAACHDSGGPRIPPIETLRAMPASLIDRALETGIMREQGSKLIPAQRRIVAAWLGTKKTAIIPTERLANRCADTRPLRESPATWTAWGGNTENTRFQTAEAAGLRAVDIPRLKLKWAYAFDGATSMRNQTVVYGGRVFAASPDGTLVSLDATSGCTYWSTISAGPVRSGLVIAPVNNAATLFFGSTSGQVFALNANTGAPLWQSKVDDHPQALVTATPVYYKNRLYVGVSSGEEVSGADPKYVCCTFRGSVAALDAGTGKTVWNTWMIPTPAQPGKPTRKGIPTAGPSGAGIWASPTLDPEHNALYVTTGDNYSDPTTPTSDAVLGLTLDTGKILWSQQMTKNDAFNTSCGGPAKATCPDSEGPDFDFGAPAILIHLPSSASRTPAKRALILSQKSGMLHAVDPDDAGRILWQSRVGQGGSLGGIQWGSASDGKNVYVALSDVRFTGPRKLDPNHGGGMFAFRVDNGERVWQTPPPACGDRPQCSPAQSQAVSGVPGAVFSGSADGHIRAYAATDGKILWDFDAAREFQTVNGITGKGGSFDVGGAVVAGGMLFTGSGFANWGGIAGNVLLAFSVDGK